MMTDGGNRKYGSRLTDGSNIQKFTQHNIKFLKHFDSWTEVFLNKARKQFINRG